MPGIAPTMTRRFTIRPTRSLLILVLWVLPGRDLWAQHPYADLARHDQLLYVQFSATASITEIEDFLRAHGLSMDSTEFDHRWFVWTNGQSAAALIPVLNQDPILRFANPVFITPGPERPPYITYADEILVKFYDEVPDSVITVVNQRLETERIRQIVGGDWGLRVLHPKVRDAFETVALYHQEPTVYSASVNTLGFPYALSHVVLGIFTVTEAQGVVTVAWTVDQGHAHAAFTLSRSRQSQAGFEPLNPMPLTGQTTFVYHDSTLQVDRVYYYLLEAAHAGTIARFGPNTIRINAPQVLVLYQNYPNPFNLVTTIRFGVPIPSTVTLRIYNLRGQEVTTLLNGEAKPAGYYTIRWDGRDGNGQWIASGVYIARLTADQFSASQKITLLK